MKIAVLGVDLGKNVCSLVGLDDVGVVIVRRRARRDTLIDFVGKLPACIVGMEACCGAHHLGRLFAAQGHDVRLMSPEYVRPYVKAQKNDDRDAEGIAEAATRPTMRFVEIKTPAQLDMQTLHRSRDRLVGERTALINQLRAILLERGIVVPQGKRKLEHYLVMLMGEHQGGALTTRIRMLVADMQAQWRELDRRIAALEAEFTSFAKEDEDARRLTTIPGVGIMNATALIAGHRQGRDFRAWARPGGMARSGSPAMDNRRQAAADGHQQARQQVPAKAVDPWSAGGVASCRGAEHASGAMDQGATRPCSSECRGRGARQQAGAHLVGGSPTRTTFCRQGGAHVGIAIGLTARLMR